jgi:hypothetical protein
VNLTDTITTQIFDYFPERPFGQLEYCNAPDDMRLIDSWTQTTNPGSHLLTPVTGPGEPSTNTWVKQPPLPVTRCSARNGVIHDGVRGRGGRFRRFRKPHPNLVDALALTGVAIMRGGRPGGSSPSPALCCAGP